MKKMIKRIVFVVIILTLVLATGVVIRTGKFEKLEGYMYSFAAEIINSATDSNATSSNVQECATSNNTQTTETIKVTNTQTNTNIKPSTQTNTETKEAVETDLTYNNSEITQDILEKISNNTETQSITINLDNKVNISEDIFEAIKGKK